MTRVLVDTHVAIWIVTGDKNLSGAANQLLSASELLVHYSVASLWEVAIKKGIGRLEFGARELELLLLASGLIRLDISTDHLENVASLPHHHRDPFDRLLVAQAEVEPMRLVTNDRVLTAYGKNIILV